MSDHPIGQPGVHETEEFPRIEGYDIVDLIGRGGMGAVYEAFQVSTGRRVAVKLLLERGGSDDDGRRRFEREVELIARLNHPGIVSVLDSGVHSGRYFYVMEFVEGRTLDEALTPGQCDPREVMRLMARVARTVDYAHQRGVMHRDLKPSNILVDERGEPRLLDFGLAKAFDPHSLVNVRQSISQPGQVIGTLGYMSPEQARGAVAEVSVRSDVYALGAIAYELIVGALPCPIDGPMALVFHRIESRDPDRPSSLRLGLDADLDAVLLKALEKSPLRRYATAVEFADDAERWVAGRPVRARRVGPAARAVRWCRRNPVAAGGLATLVLLVLVSTAAMILRVQRETAVARADEADNRLISTVFTFDPDTNPGMLPAARMALTQVEKSLNETPRPPTREAEWRERIGELHRKAGDYQRALASHQQAYALQRRLRRPPHEDVARCLRNLGAAYYDLSRFGEAENCYREALSMRRSLNPGDSAAVADVLNHLAQTLGRLREFDEAERLQSESLEMRRRLFGSESEPVIQTLNNYASLLKLKGDYAGAEQRYRSAMEGLIRLKGTDQHRWVARSLRNIAECMMERGRLEEVEPLLVRARRISTEVLEADHPETAAALRDLARLRLEQGRPDEADALCRDALSMLERRLGPAHAEASATRLLLAQILIALGRAGEAEGMIRDLLAMLRSADPVMPADVAEAQAALGAALLAQDRAGEAAPLLTAALEVLEGERSPGDGRTRRCAADLAAARRTLGDATGADTLLSRYGIK